MRRGAHILLICAILPGVLLPAQLALCVCAAIGCDGCPGAAPAASSHPAGCAARCCARHQDHDRAMLSDRKHCRGCLVVAPAKPVTPRPEPGVHAPDFAAPAADALAIVIAPAPAAHETSTPARALWPPGEARSLPLLI
jgi:hypothetical protein